MRKVRLIPRLDIKGSNLIKGVQLEGLRVIGDPNTHALHYYENGADELLYMDSVASLYGRNNLKELISKAVQNVFIPITVGGGIRSIENAYEIFKSGADKIVLNSFCYASLGEDMEPETKCRWGTPEALMKMHGYMPKRRV